MPWRIKKKDKNFYLVKVETDKYTKMDVYTWNEDPEKALGFAYEWEAKRAAKGVPGAELVMIRKKRVGKDG